MQHMLTFTSICLFILYNFKAYGLVSLVYSAEQKKTKKTCMGMQDLSDKNKNPWTQALTNQLAFEGFHIY